MSRRNIVDFFIILIIFSLDRISKVIVIDLNKTNELINYNLTTFINLDLVWNQGIAFGLFSFNENIYYNVLTSIIIIVTLVVFVLMLKSNKYQKYGFLMVFGGSLGNIFDRLYYSSVPDFIDLHINNFHWFIFNVADIFITLGVILLILTEFFKLNND
jgi:signal peptidase II